MTRYESIKNMTIEDMAKEIVENNYTDDFCTGDCEDNEDFSCLHPLDCCVKWLNEQPPEEQTCRVCGCTHYTPCLGGCYWVEVDLCSKCAEQALKTNISE